MTSRTTASLDTLPTELLDAISISLHGCRESCSTLYRSPLKNFRLVSKLFADLASRELFRILEWKLIDDDGASLGRFKSFLEHGQLSKYARMLVVKLEIRGLATKIYPPRDQNDPITRDYAKVLQMIGTLEKVTTCEICFTANEALNMSRITLQEGWVPTLLKPVMAVFSKLPKLRRMSVSHLPPSEFFEDKNWEIMDHVTEREVIFTRRHHDVSCDKSFILFLDTLKHSWLRSQRLKKLTLRCNNMPWGYGPHFSFGCLESSQRDFGKLTHLHLQNYSFHRDKQTYVLTTGLPQLSDLTLTNCHILYYLITVDLDSNIQTRSSYWRPWAWIFTELSKMASLERFEFRIKRDYAFPANRRYHSPNGWTARYMCLNEDLTFAPESKRGRENMLAYWDTTLHGRNGTPDPPPLEGLEILDFAALVNLQTKLRRNWSWSPFPELHSLLADDRANLIDFWGAGNARTQYKYFTRPEISVSWAEPLEENAKRCYLLEAKILCNLRANGSIDLEAHPDELNGTLTYGNAIAVTESYTEKDIERKGHWRCGNSVRCGARVSIWKSEEQRAKIPLSMEFWKPPSNWK